MSGGPDALRLGNVGADQFALVSLMLEVCGHLTALLGSGLSFF